MEFLFECGTCCFSWPPAEGEGDPCFCEKGGSSPLYPIAYVCVWGRQGQNGRI